MRSFAIMLLCSIVILSSCKKEVKQPAIVGQWIWVIQYADNPAYNSTPQSTGIQETLSFTDKNTWSIIQNSVTVNSGTYKTATATSTGGSKVPEILYSNDRVADSAAYYLFSNNNDSLIFSHDLIGTAGSGSRHYGRK